MPRAARLLRSCALALLCSSVLIAAAVELEEAEEVRVRRGACVYPGTPLPPEEVDDMTPEEELRPQHSLKPHKKKKDGAHDKRWKLGGTSPGKWGPTARPSPAQVTYSYVTSNIGCCDTPPCTSCRSLDSFLRPGWKAAVELAFKSWSDVAGLTFVEVSDDGSVFGSNTAGSGMIRLGGHVFDGPSGTLAHGYYPPSNGGGAAGDIHLDTAEDWNVRTDSEMYNVAHGHIGLAQVLSHEIGHALGLNHDTKFSALMNPYYSTAFFGPLADDINGMRALYGPKVCVCATGECCDGCQYRPASHVCRAAAGGCDNVEHCTGSSTACPADSHKTVGEVCRPFLPGGCDIAEEVCTGLSLDCPPDSVVPAGVTCRASGGDCDLEEKCDGSSNACPPNQFRSDVCRAAVDLCDRAESCSAASPHCPADTKQPQGHPCRPSAGACDVAETCNGVATSCPADGFLQLGTSCRASAGVCDLAETCTGNAAHCPADGKVADGTVCRTSAGPCDKAETCNGVAATCPNNALHPAGHICRPALSLCDVAELCTGSATTCPTDKFANKNTVCRASTNACNPAEKCTGKVGTCPTDVFYNNGQKCKPSCSKSNGFCRADGTCSIVC